MVIQKWCIIHPYNMEEQNDNHQNTISLQEVEEYISKSEEIANELKPIFEMKKLDKKSLPNNVTDEIKNKRQKISDLKGLKQETIKKIIGQLYNGVLIPESLSIRKGEVFEYRCQYHPQLTNIKRKIMKHLHEVSEKLSEENMDILEYCLERVSESDESYSNYSYGKRDDEEKNKSFDFDEIKLIEVRDEEKSQKDITICYINNVKVDDKGKIEFRYKYMDKDENDKDKEKIENPCLRETSESMLYKKFDKQIKDMAKDFIKDLDDDIKIRELELKEIKEKGSSQLMICEMVATSENVNGYR